MEALRNTLKSAVADVRDALARAQQDGSEQSAVAYEDTVSQVYTKVGDVLDAIVAQRDAVTNAGSLLRRAVTEARTYFGEHVTRLKREVSMRQQDADKLRAALERLTDRFASNIDSNSPLPADVDAKVRELSVVLQMRAAQAAALEGGAARLEQWLQSLQSYEQSLSQSHADYNIIFARAKGQRQLLTQVAGIRMEETRLADLVRRVGRLRQDLADAQTGMDEADADLSSLFAHPPSADPAAAVQMPVVTARGGLDILREVRTKKEQARVGTR